MGNAMLPAQSTEGLGMLVTGRQISAARALLDVSQEELAEKAELSFSTVKNMERYGTEPL
jgi:DNA-binding XRE family transcriptional regulator